MAVSLTASTMTSLSDLQQISEATNASMHARHLNGYGQHDDHVWRWINYYLTIWCDAHPLKVLPA